MFDHVDILLIINIYFHIALVIERDEHELLNLINEPLQNLANNRRLFNKNEVTNCLEFNVAKHTKERLFELCSLLYLSEVAVDLRLINTIITDPIQLKLELFGVNTEQNVVPTDGEALRIQVKVVFWCNELPCVSHLYSYVIK